MNKGDVVERMHAETGLSYRQSGEAVESLMKSITLALKNGDDMTLSGFGTFSVYVRKARNGRNPQTGALIKIKARKAARFAAGSDLRKALNE